MGTLGVILNPRGWKQGSGREHSALGDVIKRMSGEQKNVLKFDGYEEGSMDKSQ